MGMPFHRHELEGLGARFNLVVQPIQLSQNALTSGEIGMTTEFEKESTPAFGGLGRYLIEESGAKTDTILDNMAILVKTTAGLVVILGCAHRGVINTLIHARDVTGIGKIYAVVGGSHLVSESGGRLEKTIAALKEFAVERLGLCHCTGPKATARLSQEFQDRFIFCKAGTVHEFP